MADQSVEGYDRDFTWEHMNDKQNRYSHVRIVEQSDARVVVHWRYALVNVLDQLWKPDDRTGNGAWIDEYYYIYPDARGIRKVTWAKGRLGTPIQFQESLPLAHAGLLQGEVIHPDLRDGGQPERRITVVCLRSQTAILPRALAHRPLAVACLESFRTIVGLVPGVTYALLTITLVAPAAFVGRSGAAGRCAAMPARLHHSHAWVGRNERAPSCETVPQPMVTNSSRS